MQLQEADSTITLEDVSGLSMRKLNDWLHSLVSQERDNAEDSRYGRHGHGRENKIQGE